MKFRVAAVSTLIVWLAVPSPGCSSKGGGGLDGFQAETSIATGYLPLTTGGPCAPDGSNHPVPVVINELMVWPSVSDPDQEWIELYNPGPAEVDIAGWTLADQSGGNHEIPTDEPTIISPEGYLLICHDGNSLDECDRFLTEIALVNGGGSLTLTDGTSQVDSATYPAATEGHSLALANPFLDNSDPGKWIDSDQPSPGLMNGEWVDYEPMDCQMSFDCVEQFCILGSCTADFTGESGCCQPDGTCPEVDGDPCTVPTCNQEDGTCAEEKTDQNCCNEDADCPDPDACTDRWCSDPPGGQCMETVTPWPCCASLDQCDDGNPCSYDDCDESNTCINIVDPDCCLMPGDPGFDPAGCEDDDPCTDDLCINHDCQNLFNPFNCCLSDLDCDDGNPCTFDECLGGSCVVTPVQNCTDFLPYRQDFDILPGGSTDERLQAIGWEVFDVSSGTKKPWYGSNWRFAHAANLVESELADLGSVAASGSLVDDEYLLFYWSTTRTGIQSLAVTPTIDASGSATSLNNPSGATTVQWRMAYSHFSEFEPIKIKVLAGDSKNWGATTTVLWEATLVDDLEYRVFSSFLPDSLWDSSNLQIGFLVEAANTFHMTGLTIDDVLVAEGVSNRLSKAMVFDCAGQDGSCGVNSQTGLLAQSAGICNTDAACPPGTTCTGGSCRGIPDLSMFWDSRYRYVLCFDDEDNTPGMFQTWGRPHTTLDDALPLDRPDFVTPADLTGNDDTCNTNAGATDLTCGPGTADYFCVIDVDPKNGNTGTYRVGFKTVDEWPASPDMEDHSRFTSLNKGSISVLQPGGYLIWSPMNRSGPNGYVNPSAGLIQKAIEDSGRSVQMVTDITLIDDLTRFDGIFIALGVTNNNHIVIEEESQILADYLEAGTDGRLYLEGSDFFNLEKDGGDQPLTALHKLLKVEGVGIGATSFPSITILGTNFLNGTVLAYRDHPVFDQGLDELKSLSGSGAREILHYDDGNTPPMNFASAVSYESAGTYRSLSSGVLFGGFSDGDLDLTQQQKDLIGEYLVFLESGYKDCSLAADCEDFDFCTTPHCDVGGTGKCANEALSPCVCAVRVQAAGTDSDSCGSAWGTGACKTIQGGIDAANGEMTTWGGPSHCEVWIHGGVYPPVVLDSNVSLYGGFAGDEATRDERNWFVNKTVLDGGGTSRVVYGNDLVGTVVDGFTIRNGNVDGHGGGLFAESLGGTGLYADMPGVTIANCHFHDNDALNGGAVALDGYPLTSPTLIYNCLIDSNIADESGGAIFNEYGSLVVLNSTLYGNNAINGSGGAFADNNGSTITNSILWGNASFVGPQIDYAGDPPTVTYSDVQGGWAGDGNISADPLFASTNPADGNYLHLDLDSPCIDAANGDVAPPIDGDGRGRMDHPGMDNVVGTPSGEPSFVDMGAFENQVLDCPAGSFLDDISKKCEPCLAGSYQDIPGQPACLPCPGGTFSGDSAIECIPCPAGSWAGKGEGTGSCTPCAAGTTSAEGAAMFSTDCTICPTSTWSHAGDPLCTECPEGTSSPPGSDDVSDCTKCPAGSWAAEGDTDCTPCPAGTTAPAGSDAITDCADCLAGSWSHEGDPTCTPCAAGTSTGGGGGSMDDTACVTCEPGSWAAAGDGSCTLCPAGSTSAAGSIWSLACWTCPAGSWAASGDGECWLCEAGTSTGSQMGSSDLEDCQVCPGGTWSHEGDGSCTKCAAGHTSIPKSKDVSECTICPAGSWAQSGDPLCTLCSAGTSTNGQAGSNFFSDCATCPAGSWSFEGDGSCTDCPKGTSTNSQTGSDAPSDCTVCPAGSWAASGAGACSQCPAGSSTNGIIGSSDSSACMLCSPGSWAETGDGSCTPCPGGTTSFAGAIWILACTTCPVDTWAASGDPVCSNCPEGTTSSAGSDDPLDCTQCPAGYWSAPGDPDCTPCDAGTTAPAGSDDAGDCQQCPAGTWSNQGSSSCSDCFIGTYSGPGAADCTDCPDGEYQDLTGQASCKSCSDWLAECVTCSDVPDCTLCDEVSATPWLHQGICIASCPAQGAFYNDDSNTPNICKPCEDNCVACSDGTTCTECATGFCLNANADCLLEGSCG